MIYQDDTLEQYLRRHYKYMLICAQNNIIPLLHSIVMALPLERTYGRIG